MKKKIMFFVLLLAGGFCFAQTSESYRKVNTLLQSGLNKNFYAIQQEAPNIDEDQRLRLYENYNKGSDEMWIGVALDFFLGFGIGNFYQKDYLGGGIALGGYLAGLGLMIGGYAVMLNSVVSAAENPEAPPFDMFEKALPLYISGGIVITASQIFGLVRTFVFPSSYNNKLKNALDIQGLVMNIEPSMNITDRGYELTLVNFRY